MKQLIFLGIAALTFSCGNDNTPNPVRQPPSTGQLTPDGKPYLTAEGIYYGEDGTLSDRVASVYGEERYVERCKPGKIFHLDECYEYLILTEKPGFSLIKGEKKTSEGIKLSNEFMAPFVKGPVKENKYRVQPFRDSYGKDTEQLFVEYKKNFEAATTADFFWSSDSEGWEPGSLDLLQKNGNYYIRERLNIRIQPTSFGLDPTYKPINGYFIYKGIKLTFPIRKNDILKIVGEDGDPKILKTEFGNISLVYSVLDENFSNPLLELITYNLKKEF